MFKIIKDFKILMAVFTIAFSSTAYSQDSKGSSSTGALIGQTGSSMLGTLAAMNLQPCLNGEKKGRDAKVGPCTAVALGAAGSIGAAMLGAKAGETSDSLDNDALDFDPGAGGGGFDGGFDGGLDGGLGDLPGLDDPTLDKPAIERNLGLLNQLEDSLRDQGIAIEPDLQKIIDDAQSLGTSALSGTDLDSLVDGASGLLGASASGLGETSLDLGDFEDLEDDSLGDDDDNEDGASTASLDGGPGLLGGGLGLGPLGDGSLGGLGSLGLGDLSADLGPLDTSGLGNVSANNLLDVRDILSRKALTVFQRNTRRYYNYMPSKNKARGVWYAFMEYKRQSAQRLSKKNKKRKPSRSVASKKKTNVKIKTKRP